MAKEVLTNAFVQLNAINESTSVKTVTLNIQLGTKELTAMGDTGRRYVPDQLMQSTIELELFQDYAAGQIDGRLWALFAAGTIFAFEIRKSAAAVSTSNPRWTGNAFITAFPPISNGVGNEAMTRITLQVDGPVTRATA
jgi:hypothetical protein